MTGARSLLLFIHGLGGNPQGTWSQMEMLVRQDQDLSAFQVAHFTFPTSLWRFPFSHQSLPVQHLARALHSEITNRYSRHNEIVIVAHSLGGIIARYYMLDCIKSCFNVPLRKALLFAVPNHGSALAEVAKQISWKHLHLRQLCRSSDLIDILNRDWATLGAETRFNVRYVGGGQDRVVTLDAATYNPSKADILPEKGHINIVKPRDSDDLSYIILKRFLVRCDNDAVSQAPEEGSYRRFRSFRDVQADSPLNRLPLPPMRDVLFDFYSSKTEPYYLDRHLDKVLQTSADDLTTWVSGPSGAGKTAAIMRYLVHSKQLYRYVNLAPQAGGNPLELLQAIYSQVCDWSGFKQEFGNGSIGACVESIASALRVFRDSGARYLFIEEISPRRDADLAAIIDAFYRLVVYYTCSTEPSPVTFLFSSVLDPTPIVPADSRKVFEKINFIHFPRWSDEELQGLVDMTLPNLPISLNHDEQDLLVSAADGSPRYVKVFLRRYATMSGGPFRDLLDKIRYEVQQ
jgi:hypothetical protein